MDDFEQFLKRQPTRKVPAQWRTEILSAAAPHETKETPAQTPWWLAWLWPSPVAWAGVACAWLLIIGLNVASQPSTDKTVVLSTMSPQEVEVALMQQRQLVQELFRAETEPAEPPRSRRVPGACNNPAAKIQIAIV